MPSEDTVVAIDLFCGAGGFSEGLRQACQDLGYDLNHAAINHWDPAIATHEQNHPDAHQYHSKVEQLHPPTVVNDLVDETVADVHDADVSVDLLVAGPECTHFSNARGGKPVNEQKRMSPWHVLDWLEKLDVEAFIIENVGEIQAWGPVEDGQPTRDGTVFTAWVNALNQLGYSVDWTTLTAAEYGDPTSRERFFLVGRQGGKATFPEPTHSAEDDDLPDPRPAAEIIDWSDLGSSIWTRDLTNKRVHSPPKDTTMQRIAEGIRRHYADTLAPFADVLEDLGRDEIRHLREHRVVDAAHADTAARIADGPFLVNLPDGGAGRRPWVLKQKNNSPCQAVDAPLDTIHANGNHYWLSTAESYLLGQHSTSDPIAVDDRPAPTITTTSRGISLCNPQPYLLRQQDGAHPVAVEERPVPTIATRGGHALVTPTTSLVMPKNYPGGIHSNSLYPVDERPHHTVTADPRAKLLSPTLIRYSHGGAALDIDDPMPTIATEKGGVFAMSSPYLCPLYNPRPGQRPRTRTVDRPLMTVTASKSPAAVSTPLVMPFIDDYQGPVAPVDEPLGTITSRDRFALCIPELWPWGLDIKYRMLQPSELQQAQGFPADYAITGTKQERTEQIGNAVPVNLAKSLCKHVLTAEDPSLATFGGGIEADPDYTVPDFDEVTQTDD